MRPDKPGTQSSNLFPPNPTPSSQFCSIQFSGKSCMALDKLLELEFPGSVEVVVPLSGT
ncbi:unnamed protein product [Rhodiola kirilowii]